MNEFSATNSWIDLGGAVLVLAALAALGVLSLRLWPRLAARLALVGAIASLAIFWGAIIVLIVWAILGNV